LIYIEIHIFRGAKAV